jgi:predicted nucleic acid-binding protein
VAVLFDASILIDLFNPRLAGDRKIKLDTLVELLSKQRTKILIPTPALTELLVHAGKARDNYFRILSTNSVFRLESFDPRAAMECSLLLAEAWTKPQQRKVTHTKMKFDWQIVAIAASRQASAIYSDDADIEKAAALVGIPVHSTDSLEIPHSAKQQPFPFEPEP